MDLHDSDQAGIQIICLRFLCVQYFHWICSTWDGEDGSFIEILGKLHCIQGGWSDNQLHILPFLNRLKGNAMWLTEKDYPKTHRHSNPIPRIQFPTGGRVTKEHLITFFNNPKSTSVWIVLSWASSNMMIAYWVRSGSIRHSRSNIPSVMYLMTVSGLVQSSNRMV